MKITLLLLLVLLIYILNVNSEDNTKQSYTKLNLHNDLKETKYIIRKSSTHGIGCFATRNINKNEIVGAEPYFVFTNGYLHTELEDYFWSFENKKYIINGLGSYCNHSYDNNVTLLFNDIKQNMKFIRVKAIKDIKKGEELFTNYGEIYWNSRNLNPQSFPS